MQARRVGDEIHLLHRGETLAVVDLDDAYDLHQCLSDVLEFEDIDDIEGSLDDGEMVLDDEDELVEFIDRELDELHQIELGDGEFDLDEDEEDEEDEESEFSDADCDDVE